MKKLHQEKSEFSKLSRDQKFSKIHYWVGELAYHYDYFRDMEVYLNTHQEEIDETFLDALFQIIYNLSIQLKKA